MTGAADRRKPDADFIAATPLRIGAEIGVAFALLALLDRLLLGGTGFGGVDPHPFWLPVILAAVLYGTGAGLAAAAVASALWVALAPFVFASGQDYFVYVLGIAKLPLLWTIAALGLGEIATFRERRLTKTLRREAKYVRNVDTLARRYARLNEINRTLQNRVASEPLTAAHVAERLMALARPDAAPTAADIVELIALVAATRAFTLYRRTDAGWVATGAMAEGEAPPDLPAALIARAASRAALLHVGDCEDRHALGEAGVAALPVRVGRDGTMAGLVLFHALPAQRLTAAGVAELAALSRWLDDLVALRWRDGAAA